MRENIDKITKILVIHQNFHYQIFPLAIANVIPATDFIDQIFSMPICQHFPSSPYSTC